MVENKAQPRGTARIAFRSVRDKIGAEIEAGATIKMIWQNHFGDQSPPLIGYRHFASLVAQQITGKAGARGGHGSGKPNPHQPIAPTPAEPSPLPETRGSINAPERTEAPETPEYQPRKFTDFGNLESNLDRWYPPKDRNKPQDAASSSAPDLPAANASSNNAATLPTTDQLKEAIQPHERDHKPADGIFSLDHPGHDTLFQPARRRPPE